MGSRSESDELFKATLQWLQIGLVIALNVVSAAFIISVWLTKLLFKLVNELTDGALDRSEALALLLSAVVFGGVALLLVPAVADPTMSFEQTVGGLLSLGMVWGLAVGWKVTLDWWHEMATTELPMVHYSRQLNLPEQHYLSSQSK